MQNINCPAKINNYNGNKDKTITIQAANNINLHATIKTNLFIKKLYFSTVLFTLTLTVSTAQKAAKSAYVELAGAGL